VCHHKASRCIGPVSREFPIRVTILSRKKLRVCMPFNEHVVGEGVVDPICWTKKDPFLR
jgi:hypothetical protein